MKRTTRQILFVVAFQLVLPAVLLHAFSLLANQPDHQPNPLHWSYHTQELPTYIQLSNTIIDNSGRLHIAYVAEMQSLLVYATWLAGSWLTETVNLPTPCAKNPSLALDSQARPHLVFQTRSPCDYTTPGTYTLYYAHQTSNGWFSQTIEQSDKLVGLWTSLAIDTADQPHVAYQNYYQNLIYGLRYAHWTGSDWLIQTVDNGGWGLALALDPQGQPHISYRNQASEGSVAMLKHAHWTGTAWQQTEIGRVDWGTTSIVTDHTGKPIIAYSYGGLRLARWTGTAWQTELLEPNGGYTIPSLQIDETGTLHIAYGAHHFEHNEPVWNFVKYAYQSPTGWTFQLVDDAEWINNNNPLALDLFGRPHIVYALSPAAVNGNLLRYAAGKSSLALSLTPTYTSLPSPGTQLIYTHTLQNIGYLTDTYHISWNSSQDWSAVFANGQPLTTPITTTLASDETMIITVTVDIPTSAVGLADWTTITATSTLSPTLTHTVQDVTLVPRTRLYLPFIDYDG